MFARNTKGQVTIFIIIGIVIIAIIGGIVLFSGSETKSELETIVDETTSEVKQTNDLTPFVEDCMKKTLVPGIYLIGVQGIIFTNDPHELLHTEQSSVAYGVKNTEILITKERYQEQLSQYMDESLNECLQDFAAFQTRGIEIETKSPKTSVIIQKNKVVADLKYPIKTKVGSTSRTYDQFIITVPIRLGTSIEQAIKTSQTIISNPGSLSLSHTSDEFFTSVFPVDETTTIYSISDQGMIYDKTPLVLMFAVDLDLANSPPSLEFISDVSIRENQLFEFQASAIDPDQDDLTFYVTNAPFTISQTGNISHTFTQSSEFIATFGVQDIGGLKDEQEVRFTVLDE